MSSASGSGIGRWAQGQQQKQARDVACATDDVEEEAVVVPKAYIGRIIGTKGRRLEEIRSKSRVKIRIKDDQVYLRGTPNQREKAKELIEEILALKTSPRKGPLKKLDFIPEQYLGHVIGKGQTNLRSIETETGVTLRIVKESGNGKLFIAGSPRSERKALRAIKKIVNRELKRSSCGLRAPVRSSFVDAAQLDENHEFQLSNVQQPPDAPWEGRAYKLDLLEHPLPEETFADFMNTDCLREEILKVLKQIHREKEEKGLIVDMWGHFGHIYIKGVDEDEEGEIFNLQEVKKRFERPEDGRWVPCFVEGVREIEVKQIESSLSSQATKDDLRQDFTFYTPSCRDVRVKVWLVKQETDGGITRTLFCRSAPVSVKNVLTRVLSDEQGHTSSAPNFHICSQFDQRMKVNILMPTKGFDCRLSIRTSKQYVPETEKDEEEDKILESYLIGMKIEDDKLTLPPAAELQTGFDLFYQRRSLRRTYQYEIEGEQFSLTICKDQAESVDACDRDTTGTESKEPKPDIHLHCQEWDRVLNEGDWEPEQIVAKLPLFLQFVRQVQRNVVT